ncbi:AfsR/SARP family transcriptional regulator [Allorhizocola rhizosphaerae]|uniref:AfsR/SARP family transcriptional regulator n=1 Tax=Allorhizocola rhizosphaerae TaxID=1872709 RepID=UPI000E3D0305|nr:BTAD domain-containing putative transcriptional regulator [Allorhizocola rhizosphaerae]
MDSSAWTFGVLGPLEVRHRGTVVPVPGQRQRVLLATLILRRGRPVAVGELVERIYSGEPPRNAGPSVHSLVMRLRRALAATGDAGELIVSRGQGYALSTRPESVDLWRFTELRERARIADREADLPGRAELLRQALGLWRGDPLSDVASDVLRREEIPSLVEAWAQAGDEFFDAELALGRHRDIVPALREAIGRHPLREGLWAKLITALYRSGRDAEALEAYRRLDRLLAEELGLQPPPELQQLQLSILRADRPSPVEGVAAVEPVADPAPALPPDVAVLYGRSEQVELASRLVVGGALLCVSGAPGVGKTALAVHVAHRTRDHFTDGQWYVRLGERDPFDVLGELLGRVGVRGPATPSTLDGRMAAWRNAMAGRRVLLVLDDATSTDQVVPLRTNAPECGALVTSRVKLGGLVALHDGRALNLDVLAPDAAVELLAAALRDHAIELSPGEIRELATLCGHLPLALRIAAANLALSDPDEYLRQIRMDDRLDALTVDTEIGMRVAIEPSYLRLDPQAALALRMLAISPLRDFTAAHVSALLDCPQAQASAALRTLVTAHLVRPVARGRHETHDLIRYYARERALAEDTEPDRLAALDRLRSGVLAMVDAAARKRYPRMSLPPKTDGFPGEIFLPDEYGNVLALIGDAAEHGPPALAWRLADRMRGHQQELGVHTDWRRSAELGLELAERADDADGIAAMHHSLGLLAATRADYPQAQKHFEASLEVAVGESDLAREAAMCTNLGVVHRELGQLTTAHSYYDRALKLYRDTPHKRGELTLMSNVTVVLLELDRLDEAARTQISALDEMHALDVPDLEDDVGVALHNLGVISRAQGRPATAVMHLTRALAIRRRIGSLYGQANDLNELAGCYVELGYHCKALALADESLALARRVGRRRVEAEALNVRGGALLGLGDPEAAAAEHRRSLTLSRSLGYPRAEIQAHRGLGLALGDTVHFELGVALADSAQHHLQARLVREAASVLTHG